MLSGAGSAAGDRDVCLWLLPGVRIGGRKPGHQRRETAGRTGGGAPKRGEKGAELGDEGCEEREGRLQVEAVGGKT